MKIIHILPELEEGGVERHVLMLSSQQAEKGHEVTVVSAGGKLVSQLNKKVNHILLPVHFKNPFSILYCALKLFWTFKELSVEIIHAHSRVPAWIVMFTCKYLSNLPYFVTAHVDFGNHSRWIYIPYRNAHKVICVSKSVEDAMRDCFTGNTVVIRNGMPDVGDYWLGSNDDLKHFLFVGRLAEVKGLQDIIKVLPDMGDGWRLDVVGDGPLRGVLESMVKNLDLGSNVEFHGYCDDVDRWMTKADCLLFPSYREGMPLTLARAIQIGIPIIASDIGPVREMATSEEGLVQPGDLNLWKEALMTFLDTDRSISSFNKDIIPSIPYMTEKVDNEYLTAIIPRTATFRKKSVSDSLSVLQMVPELESGGVERGTLELGKYLASHGHRSIVISGGGRLVDQLEADGSEHVLWGVGKKSPVTLYYISRLRKFLLQNRVDILHLRSRVPAWVGFLAWKSLPEGIRPRLVTTFHGFYSINSYSAIMAKGEKIIAISRTIADHIQREYEVPSGRIQLIYRGFDDRLFDPASVDQLVVGSWRDRWGIPENSPPVIMLPGRLTRLKGHDIFIRALQKIKDLEWLAVCVGDADDNPGYKKELQQLMVALQLEDRIRFVGHCENMPAAYLLSDIIVSATTTRPEAFGRIAVEAQAMERPVIASAQGGSLETVLPGKTGWLVEPSDADSLAEAMREGLQNPEICRQYGRSGREWVLKNFTTEKMCASTVEVYRDLIFH